MVGYVGLDPHVRQSGSSPARHGHISKEGSAATRHVLCEAANATMRSPGPLRAFGQRIQKRRALSCLAPGSILARVATVSEPRLDTAHEAWDRSWSDAEQRSLWLDPHPVITGYMAALNARGATRVLDVGGGIGRHAIAYAKAGFDVTLTDASHAGVNEALRTADAAGVVIRAEVAPFTELPGNDATFDHVVAWNVLYHGDRSIVLAGLNECRRVLRPDGTMQMTMLSKRNRGWGVGREIRPDTFIDDSSDEDKRHPHFYADALGVCALLAEAGFEIRELVDVDQHPPDGWHWSLLAETSRHAAGCEPYDPPTLTRRREGPRDPADHRGRRLGAGRHPWQSSPVQASDQARQGHCRGQAVPGLAAGPSIEHPSTSRPQAMTDPERYTILLEPAADGGWGAWSPDLPGCVALGDTTQEAVSEMREAISLHLEGLAADGEPIPEPTGPGVYVEQNSAAA